MTEKEQLFCLYILSSQFFSVFLASLDSTVASHSTVFPKGFALYLEEDEDVKISLKIKKQVMEERGA